MVTILNFLFLLFFSFTNLFSLAAIQAALITFFVPWEYLGLWITSVIGVSTIVLLPFNRLYTDDDFGFFGEWIIYSTNLTLFIGIVGVII